MKKGGLLKGFILILSVLILIAGFASIVFSDEETVPQGPDSILVKESGRHFNATEPKTLQAKAGNVSALVVSHTVVTEAWQGYYGNITGTITLDDGNNFTMYDWALPNPSGEIYASNGTNVDWANIYCMNLSYTRNVSGENPNNVVYNINMSQIEWDFGINDTDLDGLNETFNDTYNDATGFTVGGITIDIDDGCSMAHPFRNESHNSDWEELLLSDNTSLVFTSLIRESQEGYSNNTMDFQIMVLENGHAGSEDSTTPYYFYVELT